MRLKPWLLLLLVFPLSLRGLDGVPKTVAILPSTDTSEFKLGKPLQSAYGQLLNAYGNFKTTTSETTLLGFSTTDIRRALKNTDTDALGFVYLEKQRVSVFLFDKPNMGKFIVTYRLINEPPNGQMTSDYIEKKFREAVRELVALYRANEFQTLPGSEIDNQNLTAGTQNADKRRAEDAKKLFRELSAIEETTYYAGASVGMARFASSSDAVSTINFGGFAGAHLGYRISTELGLDFFSYSLLTLGGKYLLPFAEKYVSLSLGLNFGRIMGVITENRGFSSKSIPTGTTLVGPSLSFDIPLLGALIRGDLRIYAGSATVLLGTYGVVFSL